MQQDEIVLFLNGRRKFFFLEIGDRIFDDLVSNFKGHN